MASVRVQVVLNVEERERLRRHARSAGKSLSAWVKQASLEKAQRAEQARRPVNVDDLRAFFRQCDERAPGREPDWKQHKEIIEQSKRSGESGT